MKKFLLFAVVAMLFAACTQEVAVDVTNPSIVDDAPETLTVGFEGDDTRIQLNEAQKTVWTKGDQVSVFYFSDANQLWQYNGETGARTATLKRVNAGEPTTQTTYNVVAYPYNEDYFLNTRTGALHAILPATQHYLKDSYGVGDNLMVAQSEFTQFSLKSVCGWVKLQLTGNGETIKSITFRGNDGEQVAGLIHVDTATAEATLASEMGSADDNNAGGNLVLDDTIITEITLDCGEGVTLGAEATAFYIALPPQTFEKGFTADVWCDGYEPMTISTSNAVIIDRNHIQPMASKEYNAVSNIISNNQIWYTSSDGEIVEPDESDAFGATIVSNTYNNGKGVITFSGDITTIGSYAFYHCSSLTSVNIPDSVMEIGDYAFYVCDSLTSVNIPDSVTTIGECAFSYCEELTSVTIPDGVITIGAGAFMDCYSLTSVTMSGSVTTIGTQAFSFCTSLKSIAIPGSVDVIESMMFSHCTSLTSVTIHYGVSVIQEGAFEYCTSLTSVTIPFSVYCILPRAFAACESLTSITIPDNNTDIGEGVFCGCKNLTEFKCQYAEDNGRILVQDGILLAFAPVGLTEYTIPDSVKEIGGESFCACTNLISVTIPDSVTRIGNNAFFDCYSLTSVYCKATVPPSLSYDVFSYNGSGRKIYVPTESVESYKSAKNWSNYASAIVGYDFSSSEGGETGDDSYSTLTSDWNCNLSAHTLYYEFYGDWYEVGYQNWMIAIMPNSQEGDFVQFDLLAGADSFTSFAGEYTISDSLGECTAYPGYMDAGYMAGAWYYTEDGVTMAPFVDGWVDIVDNGDGTYTVEFDVWDDCDYNVTGSWTGEVHLASELQSVTRSSSMKQLKSIVVNEAAPVAKERIVAKNVKKASAPAMALKLR